MFQINQTINLRVENQVKIYEQALVMGNRNAHTWSITVMDGGRSASIDGIAATLFVTRMDGKTVATSDRITISGNTVSAVLPAEAYAVEGPVLLEIDLYRGNDVITCAQMGANVRKKRAGDIIVPGQGEILDINSLLKEIARMKEATSSANDAANSAYDAANSARVEAQNAGTIAGKLGGISATAQSLPHTSPPAASVIDDGTKYVIGLGIPRGTPGAVVSETEPEDDDIAVWVMPDGQADSLLDLDPTLTKSDMAAPADAVGRLKGDMDDISNTVYDKVEVDNGLSCRVASGYVGNNSNPSSIKAIGTLVTIDEPITKIVLNNNSSSDDTLHCDITDESGTKIYASAIANITTEKSDIVLEFPENRVVGNVRLNFYTGNKSTIGYFSYPTPFVDSGFLTQAYDGKYYYYVSQDGVKYNKYDSELRQNINFRLYTLKKVTKKTSENVIYVSQSGNDETGDGSKENPYATIYHANEVITDNDKNNPYRIIVAQGTYTDLQERYAGVDGTWYQGVICKSYVTYESEDINRPDLCILEWDGAVGYEKPVTNANCVNKCIFHIKDNTQGVHINGFTFKSKNTRYCMHIETVGATMACDWHFENCVFEWGGRPDEDDDGTVTRACVGTGYTMLEYGEFINCIFKCKNTNSANHMIFQSHDNNDTGFSSIKRGEHIRFENCFFSVSDGSTYAHFDLRQTINTPQIKSFVELINCAGLPIYAPSETYKKNFVCTEQHT